MLANEIRSQRWRIEFPTDDMANWKLMIYFFFSKSKASRIQCDDHVNTKYLYFPIKFNHLSFLSIFAVLNVAAGKAPMQISTEGAGIPQKAIDGSTSSFFSADTCSMTRQERVPWWYVNLLEPYMVQLVRLDFGKSCCGKLRACLTFWTNNEILFIFIRVNLELKPDERTAVAFHFIRKLKKILCSAHMTNDEWQKHETHWRKTTHKKSTCKKFQLSPLNFLLRRQFGMGTN